MIVALIDNGSLEPAAHRNLRRVAAALSERANVSVHAVSWKHSDKVPLEALDHTPAWTVVPFLRAMFALGQRDFVFVPFFISPQGAIGSALRTEIENLRFEVGDFEFTFTEGLAASGIIPSIVADRVRACIATEQLRNPALIVVDHGGPSARSATLRDALTEKIRAALGGLVEMVAAASMEGEHPPLLAEQLRRDPFASRDVIVAPLFLSPGRHAGPDGDIARISRAAHPRSHLTDLVGTHDLAVDALAAALRTTLLNVQARSFA
jgi:sirohydrochlorin ferrochelatase